MSRGGQPPARGDVAAAGHPARRPSRRHARNRTGHSAPALVDRLRGDREVAGGVAALASSLQCALVSVEPQRARNYAGAKTAWSNIAHSSSFIGPCVCLDAPCNLSHTGSMRLARIAFGPLRTIDAIRTVACPPSTHYLPQRALLFCPPFPFSHTLLRVGGCGRRWKCDGRGDAPAVWWLGK